jgi:VanZ family protein
MTISAKVKTALRIILPLFATLLWIGFIFGNSLQTGEVSGEASGRVYELVNTLPELCGFGSPVSHYFVRKAAHFAEFAMLAALICTDLCCLRAATVSSPLIRSIPILSLSLPACITFAAADELLQNLSEGRGPAVTDVFIDASGALFATILFITIFCIIRILKNKCVMNNTILSPDHSNI